MPRLTVAVQLQGTKQWTCWLSSSGCLGTTPELLDQLLYNVIKICLAVVWFIINIIIYWNAFDPETEPSFVYSLRTSHACAAHTVS
jgi:hypothetical protein